jgi:AraC-like DNA-binding protein
MTAPGNPWPEQPTAIRFSASDYPARDRLDAWREIYCTFLRLEIEPLPTESFHSEAILRRLPGLALMAASRSAAVYRRGQTFIDHDDVILTVGLSSSFETSHLGRDLTLGRGEAIVLTGTEPASVGHSSHGEYISLRAPLRVMSRLVPCLSSAYGQRIPAENKALQLLVRYIGLLEETESFAAPGLQRQEVTHVHDLMALAIGATPEAAEVARGRGARAARLHAIKADIAENLHQDSLSVATVAARHRCTSRYVQMLFEAEGTTFREYVLAQRLARVHRTLSDTRYAWQKISTVAYDTGFGDLSYFNSVFRQRYGERPSDVRAAARGAGRAAEEDAPAAARPKLAAVRG